MGISSSRIDQTPNLKPSSFVADSSVDKSDAALAAQFAAVDTNNSGQIDREELTVAIQKIYGKNTEMVIIDEMLAAGDADGDGEVSLEEFKTIMRAGPTQMSTALNRASAASAKAVARAKVREEAEIQAKIAEKRRGAAEVAERKAQQQQSTAWTISPGKGTWEGRRMARWRAGNRLTGTFWLLCICSARSATKPSSPSSRFLTLLSTPTRPGNGSASHGMEDVTVWLSKAGRVSPTKPKRERLPFGLPPPTGVCADLVTEIKLAVANCIRLDEEPKRDEVDGVSAEAGEEVEPEVALSFRKS